MLFRLALKLCFACVGSLLFTAFFIAARNTRRQFSEPSSHGSRLRNDIVMENMESAQLPGESSDSQSGRPTSPFWETHVPLEDVTPDVQVRPPPPPPAPDSEITQSQDFHEFTHNEIFSVSTVDHKYFLIEFGIQEAINPNIIPHPQSNDKWIIVAQKRNSHPLDQVFHAELACAATYRMDGVLACETSPLILPIAATRSGERCKNEWAPLTLNIGPRDARVFYGPSSPYIIYGSNSQYTCFGQWVVDFRTLVDWWDTSNLLSSGGGRIFHTPTELQRQASSPYAEIEKNWFIFWDANEQPYVHYDISPRRSIAQINVDGSVGAVDLAVLSAPDDNKCLLKYMPKMLDVGNEFIHQATNSLSITLCQRSELGCEPNDSNTFVLVIFHKKVHRGLLSTYEPYAMLFRRVSPFQIHGVSRKPLWIHGRSHEMMVYLTSMNWKSHGQKYHGYSDDVIFLAFGIDDERTGGIDVLASDLLKDMDLCMHD
ncbi:hypothetical protein UA08_01003 [Talaromyces atroroseus]|uniref:Uncharacterized protein n=1 Tax=Talaromyces atroroseus TaxID=1441469 RepID=A0A225B7W5_TALAT|nr:hypothetical protein UA08_01003 [Talaromyces atroroseus]OKL64189.1 hypothetical protein UA08_01003 [Talaromyces atroroseus]